MELELHQLELRYERIRKRAPVAERQLVGSLAVFAASQSFSPSTPVPDRALNSVTGLD